MTHLQRWKNLSATARRCEDKNSRVYKSTDPLYGRFQESQSWKNLHVSWNLVRIFSESPQKNLLIFEEFLQRSRRPRSMRAEEDLPGGERFHSTRPLESWRVLRSPRQKRITKPNCLGTAELETWTEQMVRQLCTRKSLENTGVLNIWTKQTQQTNGIWSDLRTEKSYKTNVFFDIKTRTPFHTRCVLTNNIAKHRTVWLLNGNNSKTTVLLRTCLADYDKTNRFVNLSPENHDKTNGFWFSALKNLSRKHLFYELWTMFCFFKHKKNHVAI